jgi:hypothetical protein
VGVSVGLRVKDGVSVVVAAVVNVGVSLGTTCWAHDVVTGVALSRATSHMRAMIPGHTGYLGRLSNVVRSMAMHRDQHKVMDCSVGEQSAADNLATIVNGDSEHGIQVPVGASRKECG